MIAFTDKAGVTLSGPEDPELAKLWALAIAKFETAQERPPATRADWRMVTETYHRLTSKPSGPVATVIQQLVREHCAEVGNNGD